MVLLKLLPGAHTRDYCLKLREQELLKRDGMRLLINGLPIKGEKKLLDLISSRQFIERGIYNQKELHKVVNQHFKILESGKNIENHMMVIWQIVSLEIWLRNMGSV